MNKINVIQGKGLKALFRGLFALLITGMTLIPLSCNLGGGNNSGSTSTMITCSDLASEGYVPPPEPVPNDANSHLEITNDDTSLSQMYACADSELFTSQGSGTQGMSVQASKNGRWGNGFSLRLWGKASPPRIVGKASAMPGGVTLDDLTSGGKYTGTQQSPPYILYRVEIDGVSGPDTFRWSDDGGSSWQASGVAITAGSPQPLSNGVEVTFQAGTGHTVGDYWNIAAGILQATSVSIKGNKAVVSYAMVDFPYLGAVRVYGLFFGYPFLRSEALFRDTDINAVTVSGSTIYAVGAHEPIVSPFVIEEIGLKGSRFVLSGNQSIELPSNAGTSVTFDSDNGKIYATSGNTGGLTVIDGPTFTIDSQIWIDDARWVDFEDGTSTLAVLEGCCGSNSYGQINVFDRNSGAPAFLNSYSFSGADIPESKSTVEVVGGKAIIAAGSAGVHVMSTVTGNILATVPIPTAAESGIPDPNLRVANAASVDKDLIFISFGEAGIYVVQADDDLINSGPEGPVALTRLGKLKFGSLQSANHVAFKGHYLYVAAGLGGLKIVRIRDY